ncbi:hypothetical protein [Streptomyces halobius]|uniref:Uncharacterized protein n=1 Tax=Streptomyces halobius TaxID=2879846 RepID=A0ABY4MGH0_9ACTN|nr:hypothetical protein [Streptomyces halobius]UQA96890.1 hypothetical protein K9S39_37960 [Streptomyces halobius]
MPRIFKRLLAALVVLAALFGFISPAEAKPVRPVDLCATQVAAARQIGAEIRAHNAKPHVFRMPAQSAAAAAYNAEKASLEARRATVVAQLRACYQAMRALEDEDSGPLGLKAPTRRKLSDLEQAKKPVSSNWTAPPPPPNGKNWQVPKNSPIRQVYEVIRKGNPGRVGDIRLRGVARPQATDRDTAYPAASGRTIGSYNSGKPKVSPDHIVPLAELVQMRGFMKLTPRNMYVVARAPLNFQWLSKAANESKKSRSAAYVSGADPRWIREQVGLENETRKKLQEIIDQLLKSQ